MRIFAIVILLSSAGLTSCHVTSNDFGDDPTPTKLSSQAAGMIAGDLTGRLAEQMTPTSVMLNPRTDGDELAKAMDSALKGWGFTPVSDPNGAAAKTVVITYSADLLDGQVLARLSAPTLSLARAYSVSANGAVPASPVSIMRAN